MATATNAHPVNGTGGAKSGDESAKPHNGAPSEMTSRDYYFDSYGAFRHPRGRPTAKARACKTVSELQEMLKDEVRKCPAANGA